jgi:hypothetical protein
MRGVASAAAIGEGFHIVGVGMWHGRRIARGEEERCGSLPRLRLAPFTV